MAQEKVTPEVIDVPQGGFALFDPAKNPNAVGMYTTGMGPCCHILVTNTQTGRSVLCHADAQTNIRDAQYGLPSWIGFVCPDKDYTHLRVSIGETQAAERGGSYYKATTDVLTAELGSRGTAMSKLHASNGKGDIADRNWHQYGIAVNRKGISSFVHHDSLNARCEYEEDGIKYTSSDVDLVDLRKVLGDNQMMPPLLAFNGTRFLEEEEVIAQQPAIFRTASVSASVAEPVSKVAAAAEAIFKADYKSQAADDNKAIGNAAAAAVKQAVPSQSAANPAKAPDLSDEALKAVLEQAQALREANVAVGSGANAARMLREVNSGPSKGGGRQGK